MRLKPNLDPAHFQHKGIDWWVRENQSPHDSFVFGALASEDFERVLEIGPGRGVFSFRMRDLRKRVVAVEINGAFIEYCRRKEAVSGVEFLRGTVTMLPFQDETFDAVLCIEVLMHIDNPGKALAEMSRVLRPGGIVLLSFLRKYSWWHFKRLFTLATGSYKRRFGREAFDYRFDSLADLGQYLQGSSLVVSEVRELSPGNPCAILLRFERSM